MMLIFLIAAIAIALLVRYALHRLIMWAKRPTWRTGYGSSIWADMAPLRIYVDINPDEGPDHQAFLWQVRRKEGGQWRTIVHGAAPTSRKAQERAQYAAMDHLHMIPAPPPPPSGAQH